MTIRINADRRILPVRTGKFCSGALQNERSYYRGKARQSVLEPESRPFLDMAAEIDAPMSVKGLFKKFLWRSVGVAVDMSSHESIPNFP